MPVTSNSFSSLNYYKQTYDNFSPLRPRGVSGNIIDGSGVSGVGEGYIPVSSFDSTFIDLRSKTYGRGVDLANPSLSPMLVPGRNPILHRTDYYPTYNWNKSNFSNFNKLGINRNPVSSTVVNASAYNQTNTEILDNTIKVDIPGVSSIIRVHFGRRPAGVQQFEYIMDQYDTSAYMLGRSGGDTGMALNFNERWFIASDVAGSVSKDPNYIGTWWHTSGFSINPTRGGAISDIRNVPTSPPSDQSWHPSISLYRNYETGKSSNGVTSGIFDSCIIPFDFISFSGEGTTVTNMEKGGDPYIPTIWKNLRQYERLIVNYAGLEGVLCHQNWSYQNIGFSSQTFGKTQFNLAVGPIIPIYFDKTYTYNATRKELWDMDLSLTGGADGWLYGGQPFSSTVDKLGPRYTTWHSIFESNHYPNFVKFTGNSLAGIDSSDWATNIQNNRNFDNNWPLDNQVPREVPDLDGTGNHNRWVRPLYPGNNTDGPTWTKGTLFFDWPTFSSAYTNYLTASSAKNSAGMQSAQSQMDDSLYYTYILKKTAGNFATPYKRPFIASGPMAFGIFAKGDTDANNFIYSSNGTNGTVEYAGNGCGGDWNVLEFSYQNYNANNCKTYGFWNTSADAGSPEVWMGSKGILIVFYSTDYYKRLAGWKGSQYFMILGKDEIDVKNKIDYLVSSGIAKTRPTFSVPQFIQDGVKPPVNIIIS